MQFKAEDIKLTPDEISECTDLELINKWKFLIGGKITEVENKLGSLKAKEIEFPGFIDEGRLEKLKAYRRVLGYLSQSLQARGGQLNRTRKWDIHDKVNLHFVNIAREILPEETFALILQNANEMANSAVPKITQP